MLEDYGGLFEARTEVTRLRQPTAERCQWDRGCTEPATHEVTQYNPTSLEDLVDGYSALLCEPHAHAMRARLGEYE